ncbi:Voltage-dependent anion-selective channel [Gracilariopsis chorda]|uniref:Voltage-dependent anion-selective channel n=1 Tax=Gracilariopsis chorda TaxID=448386 RepID=A0A2V3J559_9FLOR|nr:Voltage-dependent anion-selective channel [Gracilariopsis chorda]|eukprot:PXF48510.1 Voltage-dependent anion-selective channel [Gracilariopsis chorda]
MVKLYKDLGKTAKKLLNDDFICGEKKIQLKTKTDSGMTYTTTGKLLSKVETIAPKDDKDTPKEQLIETLCGDLSCKYKLSGATMTTKLFTSGMLTQEVELENTGVKGLKLNVLGLLGEKQSLLATAEYIHPHVSFVAKADALAKAAVTSSMTVGMHGITAGVQGTLDIESKNVNKVDAILNYSSGKEHEATVMLMDKGKKAKFAYSHVRNSDFSVAAEFEYNRDKDSKELAMGTKYEVDRDTTLKTKITSGGSFSVSYIQDIRANTTLTICSNFNVIGDKKPSHRFGLALVIE